jgi:multidrug resistance efflux pump
VAAAIQVPIILDIPGYRDNFTVTDVQVEPGQRVAPNDPLFSVDPAPFIASAALLHEQAAAEQAATTAAQQQLESQQASQSQRIAVARLRIAGDQAGIATDQQQLQAAQRAGLADAAAAAQHSLAKAEADLVAAQADLNDASSLAFGHLQGRVTALVAESQVVTQLLKVANSQTTTITAPLAGDISLTVPSPGQSIQPNHTVLTIVDATNLEVTATLPISEEENVSPGAPADITFNSLPNVDLKGRVTSILPQAVDNGLSFQVLVTAPNTPDRRVLPGTKGFVRLQGNHTAQIAIPRLAVLLADTNPSVFVVTGQVVHLRTISVGVEDGTWVEVLSGLSLGDRCVTIGVQSLQDGAPVHVVSVNTTG